MLIKTRAYCIDNRIKLDRNISVTGIFDANNISSVIEDIEIEINYPKHKDNFNHILSTDISENVTISIKDGNIHTIKNVRLLSDHDFNHVLNKVSKVYNIRAKDVISNTKNRKHMYLLPRRAVMAAFRANSSMSWEVIGWMFKQDHATALHAVNRAKDDIKYNSYNERVNYRNLEQELGLEIINKL